MGHVEQQDLVAEAIRQDEETLANVPLLNLGALLNPPFWGIAHGDWVTILFYPLWVFCDNQFYAAYALPNAMTITLAVIVFLIMTAITVVYARLSSVRSAHKALARGKEIDEYLTIERRWAIGMAVLSAAMIAVATWFNLCVRTAI